MARTLRLYGMESMTVKFDSNIDAAMKTLAKEFAPRVGRAGAWAGATVMYREMRKNAPVDKGVLYESIYRYHLDSQASDTYAAYAIGPNKQKARHWHWLEFGTRHRRAFPYIRPTWNQNVGPAVRASMKRMSEVFKELASEMAKA